jgi:hypothetical protein
MGRHTHVLPPHFLRLALFVGVAPFALLASACVSREFNGPTAPSAPQAEFAPNGTPVNWGTLSPLTKTPRSVEARLANAAARRLNSAANLPQWLGGGTDPLIADDGIISVPVKFLFGAGLQPFADGQANRSVEWTGWPDTEAEPPVVFTLIAARRTTTKGNILVLEARESLIEMMYGAKPATIEAEFTSESGAPILVAMSKSSLEGLYRAVLVEASLGADLTLQGTEGAVSALPAEVASKVSDTEWVRLKLRFFVSGKSKPEYWPVLFRFPAQKANAAVSSLPKESRLFSWGDTIASVPYNSTATSPQTPSNSLEQWMQSAEGKARAQKFPYTSGVHHEFADDKNHKHTTATGGVETYGVFEKPGGTEVLYTCFDARDGANEDQWGVPSGAGWHTIGHPTVAETILNTFETSGIFAGWGVASPYPFAEVAPFGSKDVATFRIVRPGEAFTTLQNHAHWYAIDSSKKACAIIWKHGCAPQSESDLSCK